MQDFIRRHKWGMGYGAVLLFMVAPFLTMILGVFLAPVLGCDVNGLNEGSVPDCPGGDWVYILFVSSWYALFTLPAGAIALVVLALAHLIVWYRARRTGVQ